MSGAQRLTVLAWAQLAITVVAALYGIVLARLFLNLGNASACFDGDEAACDENAAGVGDVWRSLVVGAVLVCVAALAVVLARRGRRRAAVATLGVSVALDCAAAIAFLTL